MESTDKQGIGVNFSAEPRFLQESNREYVYRFLRAKIMNFTLVPGAALSEQEIANLLNVSRTPVREAFIQLAREELLDIMPQKGTYVSLIDLSSVEESKFLRETLESAVIELACQTFPPDALFELQSSIALQELCLQEENFERFYELDEAMHKIIFVGCKKGRIWAMMQQLHSHYNRVRRMNVFDRHYLPPVLEQHKELVRAIREQNVELGTRTIKLHLNKVRIDIPDLLRDFGQYFKETDIR